MVNPDLTKITSYTSSNFELRGDNQNLFQLYKDFKPSSVEDITKYLELDKKETFDEIKYYVSQRYQFSPKISKLLASYLVPDVLEEEWEELDSKDVEKIVSDLNIHNFFIRDSIFPEQVEAAKNLLFHMRHPSNRHCKLFLDAIVAKDILPIIFSALNLLVFSRLILTPAGLEMQQCLLYALALMIGRDFQLMCKTMSEKEIKFLSMMSQPIAAADIIELVSQPFVPEDFFDVEDEFRKLVPNLLRVTSDLHGK